MLYTYVDAIAFYMLLNAYVFGDATAPHTCAQCRSVGHVSRGRRGRRHGGSRDTHERYA